jgi:Tfp pilus assembly protein PilN
MRAVNLLPQEQRRQVVTNRPGSAYVLIGALTVILAMAVTFVLASNQANSRASEAKAAKAEADALQAESARLGSFTNFATIKQTRLQSVAGVAAGRFDWERMMREVSRLMPAGSWLQSTDASVAGAPSDPAVSTTTAAPAGPSATFTGCTPRQSDVARMMVRMREMHRVTDVKLNEAVREGTDAEATVESCGRLYHFDLTVMFSPADPSGEAPRGTANVPASLGGGS